MELISLFKAFTLFASSFYHGIIPANESSVGISTNGISVKNNEGHELAMKMEALVLPSSPPTPSSDSNHYQTTPYPSSAIDNGNKNPQIDEESAKSMDTSLSESMLRTASLDSTMSNLHRFEAFCEDKIQDVYSAIKEFNNYNYEKNQEILYLQYNEKKKQEILKQSQEKKAKIEWQYNKMHEICIKAERYRERITHTLNPIIESALVYYSQPERVPMLWYDIHNLETIVQQLFTPKLRTRVYFDESTHQLKMHRGFVMEPMPKRFLPLPKEYLADNTNENGAHEIGDTGYGHPETGIDVHNDKAATIEHFNKNILEQYTYSLDKEIQQIIVYYVFKFYEYEVQDGIRKVFYFTHQLKQKKASGASDKEIRDIEERLSDALKELQQNTVEMERNRVIPELIGLYNVETEVHKLLKDTKYTTKLIGSQNKRVITVFNPSDAIQLNAMLLDNTKMIDGKTNSVNNDLMTTIAADHASDARENLNEPLQWDQNWTWDF